MFSDFTKTRPVRAAVDKFEGGNWYDLSRLLRHMHMTASVYIAQRFYAPELSDEVIARAMRSEFYIVTVEPVYGLPDYQVLVTDNVLCYHPSVDPAIIESLKITL